MRGRVFTRRRPASVVGSRRRTGNMLLSGGGAETLQDRGSRSMASMHTLNPYYNNNFLARWQEYIRWYMTSWEARKIIDIPIEDALRKPVELRGMAADDEKQLWDAYLAFDADRQIRRALIQERLLGGALILPVFMRPEEEKTSDRLNYNTLQIGDLKAINVVDVSRLSRPNYDTDPFSPDYDRINSILVHGIDVHVSRCLVLDGNALFNRAAQTVLENFRFNPCGFGESKLATLYDLLNRVVGTQQGAYHLVNMASCLLIQADNLRSVIAADSPALAKLREIIEQLSLYRGAIVDAKGAVISQHSASFGSVPELVMTFAQLLSAASDIPATRFLGQAPGGLNATGEGDQNNYYDMVQAYQRLTVMPVQRRIFDWIGGTLWGWKDWTARSANLEMHYPSLKTMSEKEEADIAQIYATIVQGLVDSQVVSSEDAVKELVERKVFLTPVEAMEFLESDPDIADPFGGSGPGGSPSGRSGRSQAGNACQTGSVRVYLNAGNEDQPRDEDGKFGSGGSGEESGDGKRDITDVLGKEHVGVKGQAALDTLMLEKSGHVKGAFQRDDIGGIDLAWGDDKFGLQHIIKQREGQGIDPKEFLSGLGEVIEKGRLEMGKKGNFEIVHNGKVAVVTQTFEGEKVQLLLTAFKSRRK